MTFVTAEERLFESGIWTHYIDYERYLLDLVANIHLGLELVEFKEKLPVRFTIKDWKMLSIFIAWVVLLLGACLGFVTEVLLSNKRSRLIKP